LFFSPLFFFTSFYSNLPVKKIALFINIIMAIPLVLGLYQYLFKGMTRPYSSFGNPIFFGEFIAALFPILLFSLYYPGKLRLLSTVNIFLSAAALIMCSSRGVIISLLMGLAAFAWYFFSSGFKVTFDKKITWVVCSALILIWFIPGFPRAFKNTASRSSNAFSTGSPEVKNRLLLALVSIDIFRDSPVFGAGLGAIRRLNPEKQPNFLNDDRSLTYVTTSYSHNDYLQLAAETGGVGLLLFMAFAFSTAVSFGRFYPSADRENFLFGSALFSSFLFFICESFFNFPLFSFPSSALFFGVSGLIVSLSRKTSKNAGPVVPAPLRRTFALFFIIPAAAYILFVKPGAFASDFYLQGAMKENPQVIADYSRSIALEPDNYYALEYYANYSSSSGFTQTAVYGYLRALKYFPYSPDILYNIGAIRLYEKNYGSAAQYLENAVKYYPGFAAAHLALFRAYSSMGRQKEAQAHLESAVTLDPNVASGGKDGFFPLKEVTK
jgi:O-antigen ligase